MGKPGQRMVTDLAVVLGDIGPIAAFPDAEKHSAGSLMRAQGKYNLVPFSEAGIDRSDAGHIHEPLSFVYGRNLGLFASRAFSRPALASAPSLANRAASLCGASLSSRRFASAAAVRANASRVFEIPTNLKVGPYEDWISSKRCCESCHCARIS